MFVVYSLFTTLRGLGIENEDIILLPRNNGENFTLNIQNSPLKEKFYNFSFQQRSQVKIIKTVFSINSQDSNWRPEELFVCLQNADGAQTLQ